MLLICTDWPWNTYEHPTLALVRIGGYWLVYAIQYHYSKISLCCVCVCVWVIEVGIPRRGTRQVTCNLCTYYTLYCACVICNTGATQYSCKNHWVYQTEMWGGREAQNKKRKMKQMQTGNSSWSGCNQGKAAEADTTWEQQLKQMQLESSNWQSGSSS